MPDLKHAFIIPMQLETKVINTQVASSDWAGQLADFSLLPHYAKGENCILPRLRPNISDDLVSKPFQPTNNPLESGIHLHWTLPKEFRRAVIRDSGQGASEPDYQTVPNRWLIEGRVFQGKKEVATVNGKEIVPRRWLLEADALSTKKVRGSCAFPYQTSASDSSGKPDYRYLGRLYDYEAWEKGEVDTDNLYLEELNALGYGEILFSGYYPECRNVFGMHDDLVYKNEDNEEVRFREFASTTTYEFRYKVIGWYSKGYQDPMERSLFREWVSKLETGQATVDTRFDRVTDSLKEAKLNIQNDIYLPYQKSPVGSNAELQYDWMVFLSAKKREEEDTENKDVLKPGEFFHAHYQVSGKVKDANTGKAIPQAMIYILDGDIGMMTDFEGNYVLRLTGPSNPLVVKCEGYETIQINLPRNHPQRLDIELRSHSAKKKNPPKRGRSLLVGQAHNVYWNDTTSDTAEEASHNEAISMVVANTPGQAIAALMAKEMDEKKDMEAMLDALQLGLFNEVDKLDFPTLLKRGLHEAGFEAVPGERRWHIRRERTEGQPTEKKLPKVEEDWSTALNQLNDLQTKWDKEEFKIRDRQIQLYADWYKYMIAEYDFSLDEITTEGHVNQIRDYISEQVEALEQCLEKQREGKEKIEKKAAALEINLTEWNMRYAFLNVEFSLELQPGTRYWQPTEPVLLFEGLPAQAIRSSEYLTPVMFVPDMFADLSDKGLIGKYSLDWLSVNVFEAEESKPNNDSAPDSKVSEKEKKEKIKEKEGALDQAKDNLQKAKEDLKKVEAQLKLSSQQVERLENLIKRQLVSQQELETTKIMLQTLLIKRKKAKEEVSLVEKQEEGALYDLQKAKEIEVVDEAEKSEVGDELDFSILKLDGYMGSNFLASEDGSLNKWNPVYMDWEVEVLPYTKPTDIDSNQKDWSGNAIVANYDIPDNGVDLQLQEKSKDNAKIADPYSKGMDGKQIQNIQGRTFLTANAALPLIEQLERQLEQVGKSEVYEYQISELKERNLLSQKLAGFNDVMLMRKPILQLPVTDPLARTEILSEFTRRVRSVVGERNGVSPLPSNLFLPLREGPFHIRKVRLVDRWGQGRVYQFDEDSSSAKVIISKALQIPKKVGSSDNSMAYLPPRLVQPARINFRWLSADHTSAEAGTHADNSPICGYVVPNFLDNSIHVFNSNGEGLSVISISGEYVVNNPFPGNQDPKEPENALLAKLVKSLSGEKGYLKAEKMLRNILRAARESTGVNLPENYTQFDGMALLTGRPLALVRAKLDLELRGEPAVNQSWNARETEYFGREKYVHSTLAFDKLRFAVRIGEKHRANDGFFAYFIHKESSLVNEIYSPYAKPDASESLTAERTAEKYWEELSNLEKWLELEEERKKYRNDELSELETRIIAIENRLSILNRLDKLTTREEEEQELLLLNKEELQERQVGLKKELELIEKRIKAFRVDKDDLQIEYGYKLAGRGLYKPHNDLLTLSPKQDELHLGILMDPRSPLHLTTGILPEKKVDIPIELFADALNNIQIAFLTAPVISPVPFWQPSEKDADELLLQPFLLNTPKQHGYNWSWLQPGATESENEEFSADEVQAPPPGYFSLSGPPVIFDGWMKMNKIPNNTPSSTSEKTTSDE